jgi:hypothetical protein
VTDNFLKLLMADVATTAFMPTSQIKVHSSAVRDSGIGTRVVLMLNICSITPKSSPFSAAAVTTIQQVYNAWIAVATALESPTSVMAAGDAATLAGGGVTAEDMYDPNCVGEDCPKGLVPEEPEEPVPEESSSSTPLGLIIGVSVGGFVLLCIIGFFVYRRCSKTIVDVDDADDAHVDVGKQKAVAETYDLQPTLQISPDFQFAQYGSETQRDADENPHCASVAAPKSTGTADTSVSTGMVSVEMGNLASPTSGQATTTAPCSLESAARDSEGMDTTRSGNGPSTI